MTAITEKLPRLSDIGPFLLIIASAVGFVLAMELWPPAASRAERRLCDQAVDALLHSKDLVEVQRAGIIIREVNCAIGRRLTDEGK